MNNLSPTQFIAVLVLAPLLLAGWGAFLESWRHDRSRGQSQPPFLKESDRDGPRPSESGRDGP